jgi:hypothetical protein
MVFFAGMVVYIALLSLFGYRDAKSTEEKKNVLAFFAVFGSMSVTALAISVLYSHFPTFPWM